MSTETIIIAIIAMAGTLGGGWFAFKQGYANTLNKRENDLWGRMEKENAKLMAKLDKLMGRVAALEKEKEESDLIIEALTTRIADLEKALADSEAKRIAVEEEKKAWRLRAIKAEDENESNRRGRGRNKI